jgi:hypothetical protein
MNLSRTLMTFCVLAISTPASAEPIGRWWAGSGMGDLEYGYNRGDGTEVYFSCNNDRQTMYLSAQIDGSSPRDENVVFSVDGDELEFYADKSGALEMKSRVSINNLYALFDMLKRGKSLTIRFSSSSINRGPTALAARSASIRHSRSKTTISLAGSAKALGNDICGANG